jgi:hypothetical protein
VTVIDAAAPAARSPAEAFRGLPQHIQNSEIGCIKIRASSQTRVFCQPESGTTAAEAEPQFGPEGRCGREDKKGANLHPFLFDAGVGVTGVTGRIGHWPSVGLA